PIFIPLTRIVNYNKPFGKHIFQTLKIAKRGSYIMPNENSEQDQIQEEDVNSKQVKVSEEVISPEEIYYLIKLTTTPRNLWSLKGLMTRNDNAKSLEKLYKDEIEKTGLKI
ncbi:5181_t:CDS:2, partial [Gigaspora margarita]